MSTAVLFLFLLFSFTSTGFSLTVVEKFQHALQKGGQFVTDVNKWTLDDEDFRCILQNGSFAILDDDELCDGNVVCSDGEDEAEPICHALERCPPGKVRCPLERVCLTSDKLCDGISDCTMDAWDERETAGCPTANELNATRLECPTGMFSCAANMKCLRKEALCNYNWDCDDGSDEDETTCPDGRVCPEGTFHCYKTRSDEKLFFHHCITIPEVCNQIGDCPNSEDEMDDLSECTMEELLKNRSSRFPSHNSHQHSLLPKIMENKNPVFISVQPTINDRTTQITPQVIIIAGERQKMDEDKSIAGSLISEAPVLLAVAGFVLAFIVI